MKKYGISNPYFTDTFDTIQDLIEAVVNFGADPNYNITINGRETAEMLIDLIVP